MTAFVPASTPPSKQELRDARRYLVDPSDEDVVAFAQRQLRARERVSSLREFYNRHPCRMARLHLLTASSVCLARFCGFSSAFDKMGEAIFPVRRDESLKSRAWETYALACQENRPWDLRDELWLEAHSEDWWSMLDQDLGRVFVEEAGDSGDRYPWNCMRRHLELTTGTRIFDHAANSGQEAYETAIAKSLALSLSRMARRGLPLISRYAWDMLKALVWPRINPREGIMGDRGCARTLLGALLRAGGLWKLYRRGIRLRNRGCHAVEEEWPLLETLLGEQCQTIHPTIVEFYRNPGRFQAEATLNIRTLPLMFYSRLAALLMGQGLFEQSEKVIPARLRVFRRQDGSMHFVRELYCEESLRVFDSDFVLREVEGRMSLVEVFSDLNIDVVLDVEPRANGGAAVVGRDIYWRGIRLPRTALKIEFESRILDAESDQQKFEVVGSLRIQPQTWLGRYVMHSLLRRPEDLGSIRYVITR